VHLTRTLTGWSERQRWSGPPRPQEDDTTAPVGRDCAPFSAHERLVWPHPPDGPHPAPSVPNMRSAVDGKRPTADENRPFAGAVRAAFLMLEFICLACGLGALALLR
jgi:hypothetical protein